MQTHSSTRKLLGTLIEIRVLSDDPRTSERIEYVFDYFSSIEREFSRFLPESSLSILNTYKKSEVSARFLELLSLSRRMYDETGGYFNPLASARSLGYSRSFDDGVFDQDRTPVDTDFSTVEISGDVVTLRPGQSLDFGGIAKGWAVDGARKILELFGYERFFINAWGDIYARGAGESAPGWTIGIESPYTGQVFASVLIRDAAIATSGSYRRHWEIDGRGYHHLVNPRTGKNENSIVSVTLIAPECAIADAMTKVVFNAPVSEAIPLIERHGLDGIILTAERQMLVTPGVTRKYDLQIA